MSDWYAYDWELSEQPAEFHVDLSYVEEFDTLGDFTTLLYVTCHSLKGESVGFSSHEVKQLSGVLKDCLKVLGNKTVYVGYIDVTGQRRYYFYTADQRVLVPLMGVCAAEGDFKVECGKALEPNRQTYYRLLVPDRAKRQSTDNQLYIASLRARGDDTDALRRVNLHFYFPTLPGRALFAKDALELGFAIGQDDYAPERENPYYLPLHSISPLEPRVITGLTTKAIYAAEAYGGVMEHFDSGFVPRRDFM